MGKQVLLDKKAVFLRGFRGKGNEIWWPAPWHRLETDWRFPPRVIKLGVVVPQLAACRVCLRPHLACFCLCIYGITQAFCTTCPSRQGPPVWRGEFHPCLSGLAGGAGSGVRPAICLAGRRTVRFRLSSPAVALRPADGSTTRMACTTLSSVASLTGSLWSPLNWWSA